ncbi:peptidoglycan-binding domain-containing protein, partial [Patulibacter sp. S7RM1-6]
MTARTGELWRIGVPDEAWSFRAPRPGDRDLGEPEVWERSVVRSRLRRESAAARRPGLRRGTKGRIAAALVGVTLAVPAAETVTATTADAAPLASGLLKRGDTGARVKALQRALGVGADGTFGPATAKAVRAFQRAHGLQADGVVGPLTAARLGVGTAKASSAGATRTASSSAKASDVDLPSSTVRALQRALGIAADGEWGPQTRRAVRAYQRAHGLEVDGVPGPATLASLGVSA